MYSELWLWFNSLTCLTYVLQITMSAVHHMKFVRRVFRSALTQLAHTFASARVDSTTIKHVWTVYSLVSWLSPVGGSYKEITKFIEHKMSYKIPGWWYLLRWPFSDMYQNMHLGFSKNNFPSKCSQSITELLSFFFFKNSNWKRIKSSHIYTGVNLEFHIFWDVLFFAPLTGRY